MRSGELVRKRWELWHEGKKTGEMERQRNKKNEEKLLTFVGQR